MDWFLYDNDLRHERVKQIINCEDARLFKFGLKYLHFML